MTARMSSSRTKPVSPDGDKAYQRHRRRVIVPSGHSQDARLPAAGVNDTADPVFAARSMGRPSSAERMRHGQMLARADGIAKPGIIGDGHTAGRYLRQARRHELQRERSPQNRSAAGWRQSAITALHRHGCLACPGVKSAGPAMASTKGRYCRKGHIHRKEQDAACHRLR